MLHPNIQFDTVARMNGYNPATVLERRSIFGNTNADDAHLAQNAANNPTVSKACL
ncbi:hypothetical protein [uncultured Tateyamaria sp.]|uniref:hypothetical protein n=1 Tax=uncultured Tateyamaria sp. TaxID=455651 RepID=UPI0026341AB3|nr:hypothetical protein [uncultured Tateyamaria sp.]